MQNASTLAQVVESRVYWHWIKCGRFERKQKLMLSSREKPL